MSLIRRLALLRSRLLVLLAVIGPGIILLPIPSRVEAMLASQTVNGILLPVILIVMMRLIDNPQLMGRYGCERSLTVFAWATTVVLSR